MDWKNINFQHLNYFLMAAKYQNYTAAAEELFINYSTLSKAISGLETQLNIKLFEKNGRNVQLTKYGKILNAYIHAAFTEIQDGIDEIERITNHAYGEVKLSSIFTVSVHLLPRYLAKLKKAYPDLNVHLTQTTTQNILQSILDGEVDVGFCGEFDYAAYASAISREFIYNDEVVLIVPKSHPLAKRKAVSFDDIKDETFIGYNKSAGMNYSIRMALDRAVGPDFQFKTVYELNEETGVVGMVRANLGIAFVSSHAELNYNDIQVIELTDFYIMYNIYMVWQKSEYLPNSVKNFKNFILVENTKAHSR